MGDATTATQQEENYQSKVRETIKIFLRVTSFIQFHFHFCYSGFGRRFSSNLDVQMTIQSSSSITIKTTKNPFKSFNYSPAIQSLILVINYYLHQSFTKTLTHCILMIAMDYKIHDQFLIFFLPFIHFFFLA